MLPLEVGRQHVYLAYIDDSGSHATSKACLFGALILPDMLFSAMELTAGAVVEHLIPADRHERFEEFHARDLFLGLGTFEGIAELQRFDAIALLLAVVQNNNIPFVYGAVDRRVLAQSIMSSADPRDIAFQMCALGVEQWFRDKSENETQLFPRNVCLLIADEPAASDVELRVQLKKTFRKLRVKLRPPIKSVYSHHRLWHVLDDMYWGDSKESVGIQVADLCCYFVARHLTSPDAASEKFYNLISAQVICAKPEPEWTQYKHVLLESVL
jgi:hypothetical protein